MFSTRDEVRAVLEGGGVDELILVADRESLERIHQILPAVRRTWCDGQSCFEFLSSFDRAHGVASNSKAFPLLSFSTTPTNEALMFVRRILDVVLAACCSIVTLPISLLTAISHQADITRSCSFQAGAMRSERPVVHDVQVPVHGRQRRTARVSNSKR